MISATVTVSVGRNVGSDPMPSSEWRKFRGAVASKLALGKVYVADARTVGYWEGVAEESRTWVAELPLEVCDLLPEYFAELAKTYKQDAIAVTIGQTVLAS